jgi:hypothetical protein
MVEWGKMFLQLVVQEKSSNDYRAFLTWRDVDSDGIFELRGYGKDGALAAADAWHKFVTDAEFHSYWSGHYLEQKSHG